MAASCPNRHRPTLVLDNLDHMSGASPMTLCRGGQFVALLRELRLGRDGNAKCRRPGAWQPVGGTLVQLLGVGGRRGGSGAGLVGLLCALRPVLLVLLLDADRF